MSECVTSLVLVRAGSAREARAARRRFLPGAGCTQRTLHMRTPTRTTLYSTMQKQPLCTTLYSVRTEHLPIRWKL